MKKRNFTKLFRVGDYTAEVDVELLDDDGGWGPYLAVADALKLEHVWKALKRGDLSEASHLARVYTISPLNFVSQETANAIACGPAR